MAQFCVNVGGGALNCCSDTGVISFNRVWRCVCIISDALIEFGCVCIIFNG